MNITKELVERLLSVVDAGLPVPHSDEPTCVDEAVRGLTDTLTDSTRWSSIAAMTQGLRRLAIAQLGTAGAIDSEAFGRECAILAIRTVVPTALRAAAALQDNSECRGALLAAASRCEESKESADAARGANYVATRAEAKAEAAKAAANVATYANYVATRARGEAAKATDTAKIGDAAYCARVANIAANVATYAAEGHVHAAEAATYAAEAANATGDKVLADFCEGVVQILIGLNSPGAQWLSLTEAL